MAIVTGSLTGCLSAFTSEGSADLEIVNDSTESHTLGIRIVSSDGNIEFSDSFEIDGSVDTLESIEEETIVTGREGASYRVVVHQATLNKTVEKRFELVCPSSDETRDKLWVTIQKTGLLDIEQRSSC